MFIIAASFKGNRIASVLLKLPSTLQIRKGVFGLQSKNVNDMEYRVHRNIIRIFGWFLFVSVLS